MHLLDRCRHRTHRPVAAGRCLGHQHTTLACDPKGNLFAENTSGTEGADFAEAVSTDGDRCNAKATDQGQQTQAVRANGWLRPLRLCQLSLLQRTLVVGKCRLWPDNLVQVAIGVQMVSTRNFPRRQCWLVELREVSAHAEVLASLSWKQ